MPTSLPFLTTELLISISHGEIILVFLLSIIVLVLLGIVFSLRSCVDLALLLIPASQR